ncbi:peptidylprolyl isomerase [Mycoplasmatota bacterium]|nr:peptidylprolyl isomerase [Mycoplasmatota bacterium]
MNWKQILYKGLPVFLIAAVVVIVAAIVSRPKPQPKVTDSEDTVLDFNKLDITKGELYDMMKKNYGLLVLMDKVDRDLLADYKDKVDTEALEDKISEDKAKGEEDFYQGMVYQGVISSKEDPDAEEKIKDFYILSFLQKAYAKELAENEIIDEESKTHAIKEAKDAYHEDLCIITLKYDSKNEADAIKDKLTQESNILQFFKDEYAKQHENDIDTDDETTVEEPPFITEPFNCEYDRVVYTNYSNTSAFRNFVFNDTISGESFGIGDYNRAPKYIPNDKTYYFVYKVSQPKYIENFRESEEFKQYILDKLVENKLTGTYISNEIKDLRDTINLKIYDTEIAKQYKANFDDKFKTDLKLLKIKNGEQILASYKIDGETKYVKADDLYNLMKTKYSIQLLLDKINNEALKSIKDIRLSKSEKDEFMSQIKDYKTKYLSQPSPYSWSDFIALQFGAFSEQQLADILAAPELIERYMFGYKDHKGVSVITEEEINEAYKEWFSIEASHILFTFDPEDEESKALALEKGKQVINGCTDNGEYRDGITEDTCYIFYDPEDPTNEELPFAGLDEIKASQYKSAFKALAKEYSQDPSAEKNSGELGYFGPGQMVEEFENAAKEIANRIEEGGVPFTLIPVESTIERPDGDTHGFHVIYVTGSKDKASIDEDEQATYEKYIADLDDVDVNINEEYTQSQITKFNAYKAFRETLEQSIKEEKQKPENENRILAELRDLKNIQFNDPEIQAIYENINTLQKAFDPEDEQ